MHLISVVERQTQEDQEVKVTLGYTASSRPAWTTFDLVQRIKQQGKGRKKSARSRVCCSVVKVSGHCEAFGLIPQTTE